MPLRPAPNFSSTILYVLYAPESSLWLLPLVKGALIGYQWALRTTPSGKPPATADITEFTNEFIAAGSKEGSKEGSMEGSQERSKRGGGAVRWRARPTDPIRLAHTLYETLRELDRAGCDVIVIEAPPVDEAWAAVNARLARASAP